MKALICDLCGCVVPDVPEASLVQPIIITRNQQVVLERDVCLTCLEKLIVGFEPVNIILAPAVKSEPVAEQKPASNDASVFTPGIDEAIDFTLAMVEAEKTIVPIQDKSNKQFKCICEKCGNKFESLYQTTKACSQKCSAALWYKRKKAEKASKNNEVDALLDKIKKENPVKRDTERPNIYHEM